ncbi:MAG: glycosyltransferase family 2 protein [candidate division KSB1 bacterium]|nr:glycosyltransferase family 2 protein [candidate division KSB1 bacterium]MDZ7365875.1 glycosyltransferase family 2 protein [candidate division KSB1 bacterium]MDZ7403890.1 glycosyltransferase family 2 protein [candidate division KSB1 bacterium]
MHVIVPQPAPPARKRAARLKVIVVMPAYNAAATLESTYRAINARYIDEIILVDDCSQDETVAIAARLPVHLVRHAQNLGYGANQKTCYREALRRGAHIIVMLHPDGQYDPALLPELIRPIAEGRADVVLGSRFLIPGGARRGGMPLYRFVANRFLTFWENLVLRQQLSEYHTGYRAYSRAFLETVPFLQNSNGFCFDTEILVQAVAFRQRFAEIPIATRYFSGASSASLAQCVIYGLMTLVTLVKFLLHRWRLHSSKIFIPQV